MTLSTDQAVARLEAQLPLRARTAALPPAWRALRRQVIESLVRRGRPPTRDEIAQQVGAEQVDVAIDALGAADLVVLSKDRRQIVGAYPVTSEATPHLLTVDGQAIHAMCALDAVAVGPMCEARVEIRSRCRVTGDEVRIRQDGDRVVEALPAGVRVGVRWQRPVGDHAAHSMCTEMVFLRDDAAAAEWHRGDLEHHSVFALDEAVAFGAAVFKPLLQP